MRSTADKHPVTFGILSAAFIYLLFIFAHLFIPSRVSSSTKMLIDCILRILFAFPCIALMGFLMNTNGFHAAFKTSGFLKGILASLMIFLFMFTMVGKFLIVVSINESFLPNIPVVLLQQVTTGLFEESLFRGVLIGMLLKWTGSKQGRLGAALLSGVVFGMAHLLNGDELQPLLQNALGAGILGFAFAAVYLYSGNLLSCMFIHAIYDIAVHLSNGLLSTVSGGWFLNIMQAAQPILLYMLIPLYAIVIAIVAKPTPQTHLTSQALSSPPQ